MVWRESQIGTNEFLPLSPKIFIHLSAGSSSPGSEHACTIYDHVIMETLLQFTMGGMASIIIMLRIVLES